MPVHAFLKGGQAVLMVQKHEKSSFLAEVRQSPPGLFAQALAIARCCCEMSASASVGITPIAGLTCPRPSKHGPERGNEIVPQLTPQRPPRHRLRRDARRRRAKLRLSRGFRVGL